MTIVIIVLVLLVLAIRLRRVRKQWSSNMELLQESILEDVAKLSTGNVDVKVFTMGVVTVDGMDINLIENGLYFAAARLEYNHNYKIVLLERFLTSADAVSKVKNAMVELVTEVSTETSTYGVVE